MAFWLENHLCATLTDRHFTLILICGHLSSSPWAWHPSVRHGTSTSNSLATDEKPNLICLGSLVLFNYSFICHLSLKYPSLALSNQSRTLHINTEKVLQITWLRSCLWSQLVRFLKHEHNVQVKPPTKCLILLKSLMLQLSPSVFFTSVPERDVPTFWAFLPHMEAEPHTTTGVQKLAQFWFGYKSNRSSMDPYRKKYQKETWCSFWSL